MGVDETFAASLPPNSRLLHFAELLRLLSPGGRVPIQATDLERMWVELVLLGPSGRASLRAKAGRTEPVGDDTVEGLRLPQVLSALGALSDHPQAALALSDLPPWTIVAPPMARTCDTGKSCPDGHENEHVSQQPPHPCCGHPSGDIRPEEAWGQQFDQFGTMQRALHHVADGETLCFLNPGELKVFAASLAKSSPLVP